MIFIVTKERFVEEFQKYKIKQNGIDSELNWFKRGTTFYITISTPSVTYMYITDQVSPDISWMLGTSKSVAGVISDDEFYGLSNKSNSPDEVGGDQDE